ncbi:hypothetical protein AX774_g1382 [Zancudomyces culisetae]|uniref:Uncharacterized protein n=1 Tax=Zancudomyces culisetae TaxID=1213189 RepID=A0A1R1PVQ6_ZANCU|nr:hypothetical protein AX774_g1382 [Zancudomyces culisetae]|eukprot:OMH85057.1 hypothetical protein AX774_g1382 [Zancudomyces culisetae]
MQRRLSIKQHYIPIIQMPLHYIPTLQPVCQFISSSKLQKPFHSSLPFFLFSLLCRVTTSGYVRIFATNSGTATSSIPMFGSGDITVRAEKSTLFPDKFPRNLPCFPLSLCVNPLIGFPTIFIDIPGTSELIYIATANDKKSHCSIIFPIDAPF